MITLYVKTGCPYCAVTIAKLDDLGLEYSERNTSEEGVVEELIAKGGKKQVPYIIDEKTNTNMYESSDIVEYLNKQYGDGASSEQASPPPGVCPV